MYHEPCRFEEEYVKKQEKSIGRNVMKLMMKLPVELSADVLH
jgi:hypothetical protein